MKAIVIWQTTKAIRQASAGVPLAGALVVFLTVVLFWIGFGCEIDRLYAPYSYHRLQVAALLDGHLGLTPSLEQIDHGLTWHDGQVNQVWGLGVPLWMIPFELLHRLLGKPVFPDRIALLAAMALFAWYVWWGGVAVGKVLHSRISCFAFVYVLLLFPPLWNLILGRQTIFQETILYACLASIALFVGVLRFLLLQRRKDFFFVCLLAASSGLVRVTHGVYGVVGTLVCGLVLLRSAVHFHGGTKIVNWRKLADLMLGCMVVSAGFVFLAYTNTIRFSSPLECGHRLTNHSEEVNYLTRFGNPFHEVQIVDAGKELISWVFLCPFRRVEPDGHVFLPWQATTWRWRGFDQPTFDPTYLLILMIGCLTSSVFLRRRARRLGWNLLVQNRPIQNVAIGLLVWFIGPTLVLGAFYLYSPILTTRYVLDFAPAFASPFIAGLILLSERWPRTFPALMLVWACSEALLVWMNRNTTGAHSMARHEVSALAVSNGKALASFYGKYTVENHPNNSNIKYNGQGWGNDGMASAVLTLALDQPHFLEIDVGPRLSGDGRFDTYRAKIGVLELPIETVTSSREGSNVIVRVRFGIPERILNESGEQLSFLCFTKSWDQEAQQSQRLLYAVRWRNQTISPQSE